MKAIKYIHTNRLDDAIGILEKTVAKFPKHPPALTTLGHAYRHVHATEWWHGEFYLLFCFFLSFIGRCNT
jgi:hypothetical protein